jgi:hypothetical protein
LILGVSARKAAVEDAVRPVLPSDGATVLSDEQLVAGLVGALDVPRIFRDVVVELEAAHRIQRNREQRQLSLELIDRAVDELWLQRRQAGCDEGG